MAFIGSLDYALGPQSSVCFRFFWFCRTARIFYSWLGTLRMQSNALCPGSHRRFPMIAKYMKIQPLGIEYSSWCHKSIAVLLVHRSYPLSCVVLSNFPEICVLVLIEMAKDTGFIFGCCLAFRILLWTLGRSWCGLLYVVMCAHGVLMEETLRCEICVLRSSIYSLLVKA